MAEDDDWEPGYIPPRGTQWQNAWTPLEPGQEYVPPEPRPGSLPADPAPRTLGSQPWAAAGYTVVALILVAAWWDFWRDAGKADGPERAEFAMGFVYLGAVTCVYVFCLWRWLVRR